MPEPERAAKPRKHKNPIDVARHHAEIVIETATDRWLDPKTHGDEMENLMHEIWIADFIVREA